MAINIEVINKENLHILAFTQKNNHPVNTNHQSIISYCMRA